jgi:hypothetical protein
MEVHFIAISDSRPLIGAQRSRETTIPGEDYEVSTLMRAFLVIFLSLLEHWCLMVSDGV